MLKVKSMGASLTTSFKEMFTIFLIEAGADVNAFGGRHSTALKASVENCYISMKKWKPMEPSSQRFLGATERRQSSSAFARTACGASLIIAK